MSCLRHRGTWRPAWFAGIAAFTVTLAGYANFATAEDTPALPPGAVDAPAAAPTTTTAVEKIRLLLAREIREDRLPPLSLLDIAPPDDGVAGAKLAIADNNTTGRFVGQEFALETVSGANTEALVAEVTKKVSEGIGFVILDAAPKTVLAVADAFAGKPVQIFNVSAPDDSLREENCRINVDIASPDAVDVY